MTENKKQKKAYPSKSKSQPGQKTYYGKHFDPRKQHGQQRASTD
ncbi:MAG: 23S rRNA (Uracil-5-)-methyltransferase, partial [Leuconostoc sp. DORA_2]